MLLIDNYSLHFVASSSDINGGSFILQIFAGSEIGCAEIPTVDDADDEGNEVFVVTAQALGQESPRVSFPLAQATVVIEDNDAVGKS